MWKSYECDIKINITIINKEMNFDNLGITENILRGIYGYGFEKPSAIQKQSISKIIDGNDIIAQAQSGTGKTGAFTIGSLSRIDESMNEIQVIILLPTRELADQVYNVVKDIGAYTKITSMKVIGGTNISQCQRDLQKNPHIVIGTPGRCLDMILKSYLVTKYIKTIVLDEADEILSQGFKEAIHDIIQRIPKTSQICLFSATIPEDILELTKKFMNDPEHILVKKEELTLEGIQQFYISVKNHNWKYDIITDLYDVINVGQCIIYINNKSRIVDIYNRLNYDKFPVDYISGDRSVIERNEIMDKFRNGTIRILLSTDLLSRGIDIQQLSLVINYDLPMEKETYIHRIGRSGRYGRKGVVINLITDRDIELLKNIESFYDTKIDAMPQNISEFLS